MEQPPQNNEEWEQKIDTELSTDGLLNKPLSGDDYILFGRRLQDQINKAPDHLQEERAKRASERLDEHFSDQYGRLAFINTNNALVFERGSDGKPKGVISFNYVNVYGEITGTRLISTEEKPYVTLELRDAVLSWYDVDTNELRSFEANFPTVVPMEFVSNHELL